MLVVILVVTMLMGVGMFAARSATLATSASGYNRQMTQTHYWTEFAMLTATAELSTLRKGAYVTLMQQKPADCDSAKNLGANTVVSNYTCYIFGYSDLELSLANEGSNTLIINPSGTTPGSLGRSQLDARFEVEMTDLGPAMPPVDGQDLTGGGALQYRSVTLNANGQIRLPTAAGSPASASTELARARLIIGPLAK
jgi:hypothetical protein